MLRLDDVRKTYNGTTAVDGVSFEVPRGTIYGLLGPNGAGKTSLIRIITTITAADSGEVWLDGEPLNTTHPEQIGYMPEERGLYKKMRVGEQLLYLARLKGLSAKEARQRIQWWLDRFDCAEWWNKKVEELSKGMQQKVQFISTVVHQPKLLILDEPFSGLDPINTNLIKDEIRRLNAKGTTIIFSTHRMEQVEEICEYITLISQGRNILTGPVAALKQRFKENLYRIEFEGTLPEAFIRAETEEYGRFRVVAREAGGVTVQVTDELIANEVLQALLDAGVRITRFEEILPTLNEIFIRLVTNERAPAAEEA